MKTSPSCECCETTCLVLGPDDPDFLTKFTVLFGSWVSGSVYWQTSDTVAAIATNVAAASGMPWVVSTRFTLTAIFNSSSWRLGVGADASNYLFLEVRLNKSGSFYYLQMFLGQVVGGSDSHLATAPFSSTGHLWSFDDSPEPVTAVLGWDHEGCLNGTILADGGGTVLQTITKRNVSTLGENAGVFVTALNSTALRFDTFELAQAYHSSTPECSVLLQSCAYGLPIDEFTVEFSDSSPTSFPVAGGSGFPGCTFDCDNGLGTYIVTHSGDTSNCGDAAPTTGFGDNTCNWKSAAVALDTDCSEFTEELRVRSQMTNFGDPFSGLRRLSVFLFWMRLDFTGTASQCRLLAHFETLLTGSTAMENWIVDDWISLTKVFSVSDPGLCHNSANLQCRVKRHV